MAGIALMLSAVCMNATCSSNSTTTEGVQLIEGNSTFPAVNPVNDNPQSFIDKHEALDQLKKELNGKVLKIATIEDYPLSYTQYVNNTRVGYGVAFNVLKFLTEKFNFTYEIINITENVIGSTENGGDQGLEQAFDQNGADMAVAFLPIISDARKFLTYSTTTLDEGEWIMIMKRPKESAGGSGLVAPFDKIVWILILVSLLAVGPIIYGLIVLRHKLTKDYDQKTYPLPHCIWFVYGALMKQGSTLSPVADSTRLLFATWWIFITILTSFYTANLTAFLTLSQFTLPINDVEDIVLKNKHFVSLKGGLIEYAIMNSNESLSNLRQMVTNGRAIFSDKNDSMNLLDYVEMKDFVFVRDRPAIDHLVYSDYKERKTRYDDEKSQCPFAVAKNPFIKRKRTFAYNRSNFSYSSLFDPELLHLVESGIVKYMLSEDLPNTEICPQNLGGTERQLRNADLTMTYWIMAAGFCTSMVVFVTEIFFKCANFRLGFGNRFHNEFKARTREVPTISTAVNSTPPPAYTTLYNRSRQKRWSLAHSPGPKFGTTPNMVPNAIFGASRAHMGFRNDFNTNRFSPAPYPPTGSSLLQYSYSK